MSEFQQLVRDFNLATNSPASAELRANLIEEEGKETLDAIAARDPIETIDGLCDLLYVVYGTGDCFNTILNTPNESLTTAATAIGWEKVQDVLPELQKNIGLVVEMLRDLHKGETLAGDFKHHLETLANRCWLLAAMGLGLDLRPFFREVHRANMDKLSGPKRDDGKQLKPDGWQPPRIAEMYAELGEREL